MELTLHFITLILSFSFFHTALGNPLDILTLLRKIAELEAGVQRAGCERYVAHGYGYHHMYDLNGIELDNTVVKTDNGGLTKFQMHISIKSARDGIILLSPQANPGSNDLVFELGAGIGGNQFTILRVTKDSSKEVARVSTPGILSTQQYTNFYITISNGVLKFGKRGEDPIISYSDIRLKNIKYFGVSSWGSGSGKFLFDCPIPNQELNIFKTQIQNV